MVPQWRNQRTLGQQGHIGHSDPVLTCAGKNGASEGICHRSQEGSLWPPGRCCRLCPGTPRGWSREAPKHLACTWHSRRIEGLARSERAGRPRTSHVLRGPAAAPGRLAAASLQGNRLCRKIPNSTQLHPRIQSPLAGPCKAGTVQVCVALVGWLILGDGKAGTPTPEERLPRGFPREHC